jgi:hypothetical protein
MRKAQVQTFSRLANLQAVRYRSYLSGDAPRSIPERKTVLAAPFCRPLSNNPYSDSALLFHFVLCV